MTFPNTTPATSAASHFAGANDILALANAGTLQEVADILEASMFPGEYRNGFYLDQRAYRNGVAAGIAQVKEIAASSRGGEWPSGIELEDLDPIEAALECGYFGA